MTTLNVLPLLDDGRCSIQTECMSTPNAVHARCPQLFKCGTCVAWSPRDKNRYGRNSGQCMLDRSTTAYLDCNAPICPYYRPRQDSPAALQWQQGQGERKRQVDKARKSMGRDGREAPPPTPAALAAATFRDHDPAVGNAGVPVLEATLAAAGTLPVLLERFRGGTAVVRAPGTPAREVPLEAAYARIVLVQRAQAALAQAIDQSPLTQDEKDKLQKDLASQGGSMTTFNLLFKDKADAFRGQGG